jgi:hypothetical protein
VRRFLLLTTLAAPALAASLAAQPPRPALPPATVPPPVVVTSTPDRTAVAVGEPVTVVYSARIPEGATLKLTTLVSPARPEGQPATAGFVLDFEPVGPPVVRKVKGGGGLLEVTQAVKLAPFVPGETRVPGPVFSYEAPDGTTSVVRPPGVDLTVASRLPEGEDPGQLAPKPERPVRIPARSPWFWASLGAGLLAVAALVAWLVKRRKKKGADASETAPPPPPPDVELESALSALAARASSLDGDPRPFYSDLTHAAKRFLERHLGEPVLEWTTVETIRRLREKGAEPPREVALPELLAGADRVKFGRAGSTPPEAARALDGARHLLAWGRARIAAEAAAEKASEAAASARPAPGAAPAARATAGGAARTGGGR